MRAIGWFIVSFSIAASGCASLQPTSEQERQSLAPSGQMRVAFLAGPLYATKDANTGEFRGVAIDLGRSLAARYGLAMQPVVYPSPGAILSGAKSGEWDVALMGVSAERATAVDFSAPYMEVEQGYLVRAGVPISTVAEIDRSGVRLGVLEKSGADVLLDHAEERDPCPREEPGRPGSAPEIRQCGRRRSDQGFLVRAGGESAGRQSPRWKHPGRAHCDGSPEGARPGGCICRRRFCRGSEALGPGQVRDRESRPAGRRCRASEIGKWSGKGNETPALDRNQPLRARNGSTGSRKFR